MLDYCDSAESPVFSVEKTLYAVLDAAGSYSVLIFENNSIGYTCQRCSDRTWISAGTFGLSVPGGTWSW